MAAVAASGLMDGRKEIYDRYAKLAARILDTPLASVAGVSDVEQRFAGKVGFATDGGSIHGSICREVVGADDALVIRDLREDARTREMAYDPMLVAYLGAPIRDEAGLPVGSVCGIDTKVREWTVEQREAIEDLAATLTSELAAHTAAVRADAEAARTAAVLASALDAVVIFDSDAVITEFSPAAERLFRRTRGEAIGLSLTQLLAAGGRDAPGAGAALAQRLALIGRTEVEAARGDGSAFPAEITFSSVEVGGARTFACFVRDVSEARAVEASRRAEQERFREIIESAPTVTWTVDLVAPDVLLYVSPQVEALTGQPPGRFMHQPGFWLEVVHPADKDRMIAELEAIVERDGDGDVTYRVIRADGEIAWVWSRLSRNEDGTYRGVSLDVTGHQAAEQRLRTAHEQLEAVVHSAPSLLLRIDVQGTFTSAYGGALDSLGLGPEDIVGHAFSELNEGDAVALDALARATGGSPASYYTTWRGTDFAVHLRPVTEDGELVAVVGIATNMTEVRRSVVG